MSHNILVSACLMGQNVRYDGKHNLVDHPKLKQLHNQNRLVLACPEVLGGLSTPREPAEIIQLTTSLAIKTQTNKDVTQAFLHGAQQTLALCEKHQIRIALMANKSPSCGNEQTYDGSFSKTLIDQMGVTAALLESKNIKVFNQTQLDDFFKSLE